MTAGCELPLAGVGVLGCKGGTMIWNGVCSLVASGVGRFVVTCCTGVLGLSSASSSSSEDSGSWVLWVSWVSWVSWFSWVSWV